MERKSLWNDRPAEQHDTKTREVWIELAPSKPLVIGLRAEVTIDAVPVVSQLQNGNHTKLVTQ
jgi:hypothetical protein